ncbi:MAG: hypothetical protein KAG84_01255 [Bacteroidales bacterium]|nr:hypothetical protein [Bacteroidales bacterium]
MNKKITIAIAFIIMAIAIQSCKKDSIELTIKQEVTANKSIMREGDNTETKVLMFIDKMDIVRENPEYAQAKEWNYENDSAVWYIEAALNYKYAYKYQYYSEVEYKYNSIIDSTINQIIGLELFNIVNIQKSFDEISIKISTTYDEIESDNKFFVVSDVISIKNGLINTRIIYGIVREVSFTNWYWGLAMGQCNGNNVGIDAADLIEYNNNGPNPPNPFNNNSYNPFDYYTNVSTSFRIMPHDVPTSSNIWGSHMLFEDIQQQTLIHHCMSGAELYVYSNYIPTIAQQYQPSNVSPIVYEVQDDWAHGLTNPPDNYDWWVMIHWTEITYGKHQTGMPVNPTD